MKKYLKIAIDIGYGSTKVNFNNTIIKFPTAISLYKTQLTTANDTTEFEGKKYHIAEKATRNAILTRDYSFIYKYAPLIIYESLKKFNLQDEENLHICTGLSLYDIEKAAQFNKVLGTRKNEFVKRIENFYVDGKSFSNKISIFAQGQGSWLYFKNEEKIDLNKGYVFLNDIGYRTTDIVVFKDGIPDKSISSADDKGVNKVTTVLQTVLNREYDISFTEQETNEILKNKSISIAGTKKDLTPIIDELLEDYYNEFIENLKARYGDLLKISEKIIITGGGAYLLKDFPFPKNVIFAANKHEFTNVKGYYLHG